MRLLFDENISFCLLKELNDIFPGSSHINDIGLQRADDFAVWTYARQNDYTIITKDSDIYDIGFDTRITSKDYLD